MQRYYVQLVSKGKKDCTKPRRFENILGAKKTFQSCCDPIKNEWVLLFSTLVREEGHRYEGKFIETCSQNIDEWCTESF